MAQTAAKTVAKTKTKPERTSTAWPENPTLGAAHTTAQRLPIATISQNCMVFKDNTCAGVVKVEGLDARMFSMSEQGVIIRGLEATFASIGGAFTSVAVKRPLDMRQQIADLEQARANERENIFLLPHYNAEIDLWQAMNDQHSLNRYDFYIVLPEIAADRSASLMPDAHKPSLRERNLWRGDRGRRLCATRSGADHTRRTRIYPVSLRAVGGRLRPRWIQRPRAG